LAFLNTTNARPNSAVPRRRRLLGSGVAAVASIPNVEEPVDPKVRFESVLSKLKVAGVGAKPGNERTPVPLMSKYWSLSSETVKLEAVNVARPEPTLKVSSPGELKKKELGTVTIVPKGILAKSPVVSATVIRLGVWNVTLDEVQVSFPPETPIVPLTVSANARGVIARAAANARNASEILFIQFSINRPRGHLFCLQPLPGLAKGLNIRIH
jgi:hypothetical protein